jgi:hypothetical protein
MTTASCSLATVLPYDALARGLLRELRHGPGLEPGSPSAVAASMRSAPPVILMQQLTAIASFDGSIPRGVNWSLRGLCAF